MLYCNRGASLLLGESLMRVLISVLGAASMAAPAFAQHFTADYAGSPIAPVAIAEITIGTELEEKGSDYGRREFDRLIRTLTADLERELRSVSLLAEGDTPAMLHVVIEDATPTGRLLPSRVFRACPGRAMAVAARMSPRNCATRTVASWRAMITAGPHRASRMPAMPAYGPMRTGHSTVLPRALPTVLKTRSIPVPSRFQGAPIHLWV